MLYVPMTLKTSSIISLLYTAKCKNVHLHYRTMFNTFSFSMQLTGKMNTKLWGPSNPHDHKVSTLSEERKFLAESGWFQTQDLLQRTIFTKQWIYCFLSTNEWTVQCINFWHLPIFHSVLQLNFQDLRLVNLLLSYWCIPTPFYWHLNFDLWMAYEW
jgi:hypothetical protein